LDRSFIWYHAKKGIGGSESGIVLSLGGRAVMILFAVSEEKNRWLQERMEALGIHEKDIEERFVRSSGSGGQKVNKASTCVYLRHIPTGVEIKCMKERSQSLNRFLARRELVRRVARGLGKLTPEDMITDKARRKKSKRKKRARLKYRLG
jgi:protein subunit release factor B